jgi:hypothetical protein
MVAEGALLLRKQIASAAGKVVDDTTRHTPLQFIGASAAKLFSKSRPLQIVLC